jgi:Mn2+/Fe2+ NRAMP family transporter
MQVTSAQSVLGHPESNRWLLLLARGGYAVKGAVYGIMGALALAFALGAGGKLGGGKETVEHVGRQPFGDAALVVIGVGLLAYALWRVVEAVTDSHNEGSSPKGIAKRLGAFFSALVNGAVGVAALQFVLLGDDPNDGGAKGLAATLMREPWGLLVIGVLGAAVTCVGVSQVHSGFTDRFTKHVEMSSISSKQRAWVLWSGRVGHVARGIVFAIIGVALIQTAVTTNPNQAKGVGEALRELAQQPFGPVLLVAVAFGLLAYGVHLVTTVPYRRLIG